MNESAGSRRFELRECTAAVHAELDRRVGTLLTTEDYRRYLNGIASFRLAAERQLDRLPASLGNWQPGRISPAISSDLADLGLPLPRIVELDPSALKGSGIYGALYVLEGSALGARLLYRQAQQLGFTSAFGARHLAGQTASIDGWRSFLGLLETVEPFDMADAAAAADSVFRSAMSAFESDSVVAV